MSRDKGEKVDNEIQAQLARIKERLTDQRLQSLDPSGWFAVIEGRVKTGLKNRTPAENIKAYLNQEEEFIDESLKKATEKTEVAEVRKLHPGPLVKSQPKSTHKIPTKVMNFIEDIKKELYKKEDKAGGIFKVMVFEKRLVAIQNEIIQFGGAKRFYDELNAMKKNLMVTENKPDPERHPGEIVVRLRINAVDAEDLQRLMGEYAEGFHVDHKNFTVAKQEVGVIQDHDEQIEIRLVSIKEDEVSLMLRCPAEKEDLGVFILTDLCQEWEKNSLKGFTIEHIEDKTQAGDVREQLSKALNDDERPSSPNLSGD